MNAAETLAIKRQLRRAWTPFFGRFGRLLGSQLAAIPEVLQRKNVFLSAATASGKTEALMAPLAELAAGNAGPYLSVVYVVPTRALVNDIERRCRPPLEDMGFTCRVRTGDRPEFNEQAPSTFLITTPESLDSVLTRKPSLFAQVEALVLDELHLVDKTYRGDQLRLLTRRLAISTRLPLQVCAASATMHEPSRLAERYAENAVIINVGGGRQIDETLFNSLSDAAEYLRDQAKRLRKVLAFANSRRAVEYGAAMLKQALPTWPVLVHHGSLDRKEREETEKALRELNRWMCSATTTLEVGIDIGDVDAVLLLEPPLSVASLLQRIGRGNRGEPTVRVLAVAGSTDERFLYEEQFKRAREGLLDERTYEPDLSVVVQQCFAIVSGSPGGLADYSLRSLFVGFCEEVVFESILAHLVQEGHLTQRQGAWYASAEVMDMAAKGLVYSNIPNSFGRSVIDASTGQRVGEVWDVIDNIFMLGGRAWRVTRFDSNVVYVVPAGRVAEVAMFQTHPSEGAFSRFLPPSLRSSAVR